MILRHEYKIQLCRKYINLIKVASNPATLVYIEYLQQQKGIAKINLKLKVILGVFLIGPTWQKKVENEAMGILWLKCWVPYFGG